MTSHIEKDTVFRMPVEPTEGNGLSHRSMVMAGKLQAIGVKRFPQPIGRLDPDELTELDRALNFVLGL